MNSNFDILKLNTSDQNIWFTSDMHLGHKNILKFCNRPFDNVEEMNFKLIENWNSKVKENDIVFNLGDVAFGNPSFIKDCLSQLKGKHYLIIGNHDLKNLNNKSVLDMFEDVSFQRYLIIDGRCVYLNHYPFLCYGGVYRNPENTVYQLYGHVHSGPNCFGKDIDRLQYTFPFQYDVGVDNNNYYPISFEEVNNKIKENINNYNG